MLNREDVERIVENVLSQLVLDVQDGDFTQPNSRTIILRHGDRIITRAYFDVVQTREYDG